jgi:hypothetical protein
MRDLERYNRNIRNENRTSISTGKGEPKLQEGNEGDIRINSTKGGVKLYAKYKDDWHSMGLAKILNTPKKISPIGIPTIEQDEIEIRKVVEHADPDETYASFEYDIRVLALKVNEIIEKIQ